MNNPSKVLPVEFCFQLESRPMNRLKPVKETRKNEEFVSHIILKTIVSSVVTDTADAATNSTVIFVNDIVIIVIWKIKKMLSSSLSNQVSR